MSGLALPHAPIPRPPSGNTRTADAQQKLARQHAVAGRVIRIGVFALGSIGLLLMHVIFGHEDFDLQARIWAAVAGIVALGTVLNARRRTLPFGAYATTLLYVAFGLGTFNDSDFHGALGSIPLRQESFTLAAFAAALMSVTVLAGIPLGRRLGRRVAPVVGAISPDATGPGFVTAAYLTASLVLLINATLSLRSGFIPAALAFPAHIASRPALAQGILLVAALRSGDPRPRAFALAGTVLISLIGISTGSLTPGLIPWISFAVLAWVVDGELPWRGSLVVLGLLLVLNPAKAAFREVVWFGSGSSDIGLLGRVQVWQDAVVRTWTGDNVEASKNLDATADRVSLLAYAAQSVEWVPTPVAESGFERWLAIPSAFVPRLLWSDKPDLTLENNVAYTRAFGLQTTEGARQTTIAFPIIADGYWAARFPGVVLAGFFLGLFYGFVEGALRRERWATMVVGVTLLASITPTTHLGSSLTGFPQALLGSLSVMWFAALVSRFLGARAPGTRSGRGAQA